MLKKMISENFKDISKRNKIVKETYINFRDRGIEGDSENLNKANRGEEVKI